ncbi:MAG: zinc-binding protein [Alcanivorax borkumensis]|uniref:tRNA-specific adenosine deaminase n=1 Tax=Alcanivorax borkumensis (strain ATCC 700651 / DSM 11573 / NCIMB 13689 / SK2) TaxID=393595 RepID=Q0VRC9_ALCBS|nr:MULTISPECIES: tRNA adenosine(34) deaminase TadA [Alcanivorax]OJH08497.1 MAG: zinc-binding protein [Alcanivorax borkumensis]EUC69726.1 CRISPR-associated protein Csn1 [Alcanivorax sp. 97CO-5]PKG01565.1 tRNA adenosine(34) deaminase TadA [Alcanivorax sp. 97CO-6]CAL16269.1 cytidine/deoxycytidylate deaminase family protein [Alcanivorax borkumensis SK2]BAP13721.1 cytidine/deoxycytidylate deaminase family protein [Alcanivorax sp. NBRC 101098]
MDDQDWMQQALMLARQAADQGEVPVGALVVRGGQLLGQGYNQPITANDPSAHAEIIAMRSASLAEKNYRLSGCTLYVTLEPCTMCFGAMVHARIGRLVYGASEPRAGVCESQLQLPSVDFYNHRVEVEKGVLAEESAMLLKRFFADRRKRPR